MLAIVLIMAVIVLLAVIVVVYVVFPRRGEDIPGAPWLGGVGLVTVRTLRRCEAPPVETPDEVVRIVPPVADASVPQAHDAVPTSLTRAFDAMLADTIRLRGELVTHRREARRGARVTSSTHCSLMLDRRAIGRQRSGPSSGCRTERLRRRYDHSS